MDPLHYLEPAATRVRDPLSGRSIWLANLLRDPKIDGDTLSFSLAFKPEHSADDRSRMREALIRNLAERGWAGEIVCTAVEDAPKAAAKDAGKEQSKEPIKGMSNKGGIQPHGGPITKGPLEGVKHIVAVASGKGGVGKSTVATNLAVGLALEGYNVGLLDADIYGPSLPLMMRINGRPMANEKRRIVPLSSYGVKCMSIGFMVDEKEPIIWRGPMVMGVINQFFKEVDWAPLDYLIIDLPPGTGDVQLTMIQAVELSGGIIVTTPQAVATLDAVRGVEMFRKLEVPVLGVVENMAWFPLPGGQRAFPFGQGGGRKIAEDYDVPLLAELPLLEATREGGDNGRPVVLDRDMSFLALAQAVASALPV